MTAAELASLEKLSCAVFDLSVPIEVTASSNQFFVPVSEETTRMLKKGFSTEILDVAPPDAAPIRHVKGGFFYENGFVTEKPHGSVPWAHIICVGKFRHSDNGKLPRLFLCGKLRA